MIYSNIMYSYNNKNINYEIYNNLSNIDNMNNIIKNALNSILKENNKETKIKNIMILNNKIKKNEIHKENRKEINLVYKSHYNYECEIFGKDFVANNRNNISLIINDKKSILVSKTN